MNPKNTEEEYWLALLHAPSVGPVNFARLIAHFGNPREVFEAGHISWQDFNMSEKLLNYLQNPNWEAVEKDMQWLAHTEHHLLTLEHPDYPPLLRSIDDPPSVLFVHGDCALLSSQQLAIVGTRHPTHAAEQTAGEFAEYLSHQGFTITSGMALGIDGAGHRGALAGTGKTIAVAGTGLDRVYPAAHRSLAYKIAETGALISELPIGTPVRRSHFPIRSRIVSGLSLGTIVIEAPQCSGALYATKHAVKQGREVFAIPGSIHNPLAKGCHRLIKDGAKLVETAADILEELPSNPSYLTYQNNTELPDISSNSTTIDNCELFTNSTTIAQPQLSKSASETRDENRTFGSETSDENSDYKRLLDYLQTGPTSIDNLVEQCGLTAGEVSSMLLILELRGLVAIQPGGFYMLK